jgi:hypothetical protein
MTPCYPELEQETITERKNMDTTKREPAAPSQNLVPDRWSSGTIEAGRESK